MSILLTASYFGPKEIIAPTIILHGLFGSARNWQTIARNLASSRSVWALDLRNHGRSPWATPMTYPAMTQDVIHFIENLGQGPVTLIGHSMGGKVAMFLALTRPSLVSRLLILDIAPVTYDHMYIQKYTQIMQQLPIDQMSNRRDAEHFLTFRIPEGTLRAFFLQNLIKDPHQNQWSWCINLNTISDSLSDLADFPPVRSGTRYTGPTLFVRGETSPYILPEHFTIIDELFLNAHHDVLLGANHWLHIQQPQAFMDKTWAFLDS